MPLRFSYAYALRDWFANCLPDYVDLFIIYCLMHSYGVLVFVTRDLPNIPSDELMLDMIKNLKDFRASVECETPNKNIHTFEGALSVEKRFENVICTCAFVH